MRWVDGSGVWERHQNREIKRYLRQCVTVPKDSERCVPLYPGSMLFNQIAIIDGEGLSAPLDNSMPRFESLDSVYEALGSTDHHRQRNLSKETLLVDCQAWWPGIDEILQAELIRLGEQCASQPEVIVFSGRYTGQVKKICSSLSIPCRAINPRWWCAASLLCVYRQSKHTIFVNTARSLDAAMTGAACSLIVDQKYRENAVFPALHRALSQLPCCNIPQAFSVNRATSRAVSGNHVIAVENSAEALHTALFSSFPQQTSLQTPQQKKQQLRQTENSSFGPGVVIRSGVLWQQCWKNAVANFSVSTRRKARKLVEDPRAFFADSRIPLSGLIASAIPQPAQQCDVDHSERNVS